MTLYAILAGAVVLLGYVFGLRRKASRERDARVKAEIERDQQRTRAEAGEAKVQADATVRADQADGHVDARAVEHRADAATAAGDPHPERAAARERAAAHVRDLIARGKR